MSYQFIYDEEAVIQDADIEQAHMIARGNYLDSLIRRGVCIHDAVVGVSFTGEIFYPEQEGLEGDELRCRDCGIVFANDDDWMYTTQNL